MEVLIVSKTQMKSAVCVGGLLLDYDANIRLLNPGNKNQPIDTDFEIGQIWDLRFIKRNPLHLPHTEDRIILEKKYLRDVERIESFIKDRNINLVEGDIQNLFEGKLKWTQRGSGYVSEEDELPEYSVGFWITNEDLAISKYEDKVRYIYSKEPRRSIAFVGFQEAIKTINKGTIIRVSLTRAKAFEGVANGKKVSWLQLSGWYENKEAENDFDDDLPF